MKTKTTIGINGFGRIGRNLFRLLINHPTIDVVAVNDLADSKTLSHLLKYDSFHGVLKEFISFTNDEITVASKKVRFTSEKHIEAISRSTMDVVIECTGKFTKTNQLEYHV